MLYWIGTEEEANRAAKEMPTDLNNKLALSAFVFKHDSLVYIVKDRHGIFKESKNSGNIVSSEQFIKLLNEHILRKI